jgi:hypothetical protein
MNDEFEGIGGSYLLDPVTGLRTLTARTEPPPTAEQPTTEPAQAGFFTPVDSGASLETTEPSKE